MRRIIKDYVKIVSYSLPILEPICEFGSLQVPGQECFADLRPLFPGKRYNGCDMRAGMGVDKILNLHDIDLAAESVGTVLCLDTLEHVEFPRKAMSEIHRILKPDGMVVISSVMNYPIHDHPYDYWRFTPEAFTSILQPFASSFVGFAGYKKFPHTIVGLGFKGENPLLSTFRNEYEKWHYRHARSLEQFVRVVTPPFLLPLVARLHNIVVGAIRRKK